MSPEMYLGIFGCVSILTLVSSFVFVYLGLQKEYARTVKLDIPVEEMLSLEERLRDFLRDHQLPESVGIKEIAHVLKITRGGEDSTLSSQADLSEPDESGVRKVTFKKGLTPEKKNFAYAHECAHLVNEDVPPYTRPEGHNKAYIEQRADYTAAAMLMPKDEIYEYLESLGYIGMPAGKRVRIVRSLCRQYQVSEIIVLRRIQEVYKLKRS